MDMIIPLNNDHIPRNMIKALQFSSFIVNTNKNHLVFKEDV